MATKSGVAHVEDVKVGVTLFLVRVSANTHGTRSVSLERRRVTGKPDRVKVASFYDYRIYCVTSGYPPGTLYHSNWFAGDMGIYPRIGPDRARRPGFHFGHRTFLTFKRADAYRKLALSVPQTEAETRDAHYRESMFKHRAGTKPTGVRPKPIVVFTPSGV
jgi:hypothetical protein